MKDGSDARTQLELALVKAAVPKVDASAKALQSRLERLEAAARPRRPGRDPPSRRPQRPRHAAGQRRAERARSAGRPAPRRRRSPAAAAPRVAPLPRPLPHPRSPPLLRRAAPRPRAAPPGGRSARRPRPAPLLPAGRAGPHHAAPPPPSRSTITAVAVIEQDLRRRAIVAAVGLDLDGFAELWPAVIESIQGARPLMAEHLKVGAADRARRRRADPRWAETSASLAARRRTRQPRADRPCDPRRHRRLAPARPRDARRVPASEAQPLGRELIERFVEEFEAEILPAPKPRPVRGDVLMPPQPNCSRCSSGPKMQAEMMAAQESLKDERVEAAAGGGMVKVVATASSRSSRSPSTPPPSTRGRRDAAGHRPRRGQPGADLPQELAPARWAT